MIGYHYTSEKCWKSIKRDGWMNLYPLTKDSLLWLFGYAPAGIFIFPRKLNRIEHAGSILWQMANKGESRIVMLAIEYSPSNILTGLSGETLELTHNGTIGSLDYHTHTPVVALKTPVSLDKISFLHTYEFEKAFMET